MEAMACMRNPSVGMWQVPSAGKLSFNFSLESEIEALRERLGRTATEANMSGIDERDFVGFLQYLGHFLSGPLLAM